VHADIRLQCQRLIGVLRSGISKTLPVEALPQCASLCCRVAVWQHDPGRRKRKVTCWRLEAARISVILERLRRPRLHSNNSVESHG